MSEEPGPRELVARAKARWPLIVAVGCLALIPVVRALGLVRSSSKLQYSDYWPMLDGMLTDGGGWRWQGLLAPRNEHPIAIPKTIYLLNAELFGGSNHTLGYIVVLIVIIQIVLIGWLALRTDAFARWSVAAVTVAAAFLLLAPQGAWNFVKAMSGTAWLSANVLVLAALVAQRADRRFLTPALGLLATASYGTGLAVWPALALVAVLHHRRAALREWPTFVAGAIALSSYLVWYLCRPASPIGRPSTLEQASNALALVGSVITTGPAAAPLGAVAVIGVVVCSALLAAERSSLPWIGLGAYGITACCLISRGRFGPLADFDASRYTSLSAITWLALVALVLVVLPKHWPVALLPVPLVLVVAFGGQGAVDSELQQGSLQEVRAIALRLGLSDDAPGLFAFEFPAVQERLELTGHYPFNDDFSADCGELGNRVPTGDRLPDGVTGRVQESFENQTYPTAAAARGRIENGQMAIDCVVVLNESDTVVGIGAPVEAPVGDALVFTTLAPPQDVHRVFIRVAGSSEFVPLDDPTGVGVGAGG